MAIRNTLFVKFSLLDCKSALQDFSICDDAAEVLSWNRSHFLATLPMFYACEFICPERDTSIEGKERERKAAPERSEKAPF